MKPSLKRASVVVVGSEFHPMLALRTLGCLVG